MCCLLHFQQVVKLSSEVEEEDDTDHKALMEGYVSSFSTHHVTVFIIFFFCVLTLIGMFCFLLQITITPLGALSRTEVDAVPYFEGWLHRLADYASSSSL